MEKGNFTKQFEELISNWESDGPEITVKGTTVFDDGNEEYIVLVIDCMDEDSAIYEDYDGWVSVMTKITQDIIDEEFQEGDHAVTLEKVSYGNDSIIILITCLS